MRIFHVVNSLRQNDGGTAQLVPGLAHAQFKAGADVTVWTRRRPTIDLSSYSGVRFRHDPLNSAIVDVSPDILHNTGLWLPANHQAISRCLQRRIPTVVSPQGMLEPWCLNHRRIRKTIAWGLYQWRDLRSASMLHATSAVEAATFRRLGLQQPIIELPNGISPPQNEVSVPEATADDRQQLLFLSRIHPVKGIPNLLKAWASLRPARWVLQLVGPSEDGHAIQIQKLIEKLNIADSVRLHNGVGNHEKWSLLKAADALVLPSLSESFGIVIAESLLMKTPVLTTTAAPWNSLIGNGCGWQVSPDVDGLRSGVEQVISTPSSHLKEMGQRGCDWVSREFLWESIGQKMLDAYGELIGRTCSVTKQRLPLAAA